MVFNYIQVKKVSITTVRINKRHVQSKFQQAHLFWLVVVGRIHLFWLVVIGRMCTCHQGSPGMAL
jgi:hypothetical protein